jgi:hypothetical protein
MTRDNFGDFAKLARRLSIAEWLDVPPDSFDVES